MDNYELFEQLSFDELLKFVETQSLKFSSKELAGLTNRINDIKSNVKKKEFKERRCKEKEQQELMHKKHVDEVTSMDLPLDFENIFNTDERTYGVHAESVSDGLIICLNNLGYVDIEYISSVTGESYKDVICALKGSIFQNPETWNECFYKGWETADEYLSGNMLSKLRIAKKANEEYMGYFKDNIDAIEKVLPQSIAINDIYITLGSPWVPTDIIEDFIHHLFGNPYRGNVEYRRNHYVTLHDDVTGSWEIKEKNRYPDYDVGTTQAYGTKRMSALHIIEKTLNMRNIAVYDTRKINNKTIRELNKTETLAVVEKQKKLIKAFQDWVWTDDNRKQRLKNIYENKFGCVRQRNFDGSFLSFPNMSSEVKLYPYQKNAVARMIFSANTLLAHDVGAGKTYEMIAAGQELKRMRFSNKNMYVVPNNIVGQWKDIFEKMYPNAKLLCIDPKSFKPNVREEVLNSIINNDYDGIIIAYSCFEQIPISKEFIIEQLENKKSELEQLLNQAGRITAVSSRKKEYIERQLIETVSSFCDSFEKICFDDLGITRLFVDEAHNFKNVFIDTKINGVLGISSTGSKKCKDMMDKVHIVQKQNDGKGVVFATGTPITNSITDVYVMQKYLQSGELALIELQSFDNWIGMFAEKQQNFEIDVDTLRYRIVPRFSKFHNLPELTTLLSSIADFHRVDKSQDIPDFKGYIDEIIPKTKEFEEYLKEISERADMVRGNQVSRKDDNMLKITTDGRKAALDLRLVLPDTQYTQNSKVAYCVKKVSDIYYQNKSNKATQLIFCDISTPKADFNIYDELKENLIFEGIPQDEIAFIHDATTLAKKNQLFKDFNSGKVRILIGSTFKLGIGVNIQKRLVALHHLDVPWRPADITQREGRIIRQGNTNQEIKIFRYITKGSFDAYSWQLLETKQDFISKLLSGSLCERSSTDVENTVLDYAEVKALAIGNPKIKERVETANELSKYFALQKKFTDTKIQMEKELLELPSKIENQRKCLFNCKRDIEDYSQWCKDNPELPNKEYRKKLADSRRMLRESINNQLQNNILETKERNAGKYKCFDIILPANMTKEKRYIWISHFGRYYIELGNTELGILPRIDNFLNSLDRHYEKLSNGLKELVEMQIDLKNELKKNENYQEKIDELKSRLEKIDIELGVDINGRNKA